MQPIGPLMIEHRLIEKMIPLMEKETAKVDAQGITDVDFIDAAVDFFRIYADRCHHGKEEDILFRDLKTKSISAEHNTIMDRLLAEHVISRNTVGQLLQAKENYLNGSAGALAEISTALKKLIKLYPEHIKLEDQGFFIPVMVYFSDAERDKMLAEMYEFDRNIIHRKYQKIVAKLSNH